MRLSNIYAIPLGPRDATITAPQSARIASISPLSTGVGVVFEIGEEDRQTQRNFRIFTPGSEIPQGYSLVGSCTNLQNPYLLYER